MGINAARARYKEKGDDIHLPHPDADDEIRINL